MSLSHSSTEQQPHKAPEDRSVCCAKPLTAVARHPGAVIASDVRMSREALDAGPFVYCDVQVCAERQWQAGMRRGLFARAEEPGVRLLVHLLVPVLHKCSNRTSRHIWLTPQLANVLWTSSAAA